MTPTAPAVSAPTAKGAYLTAALSSYLIWALLIFPIRWVQGVPPPAIIGTRISFAAIILWTGLLLFQRNRLHKVAAQLRALSPAKRRENILRTIAGGLLIVANWSTYIYVVNQVNIRTASFAYLIVPVLVAVLAYFLLREKLKPLQWVSVALAAASCIVLGRENVAEVGYSLVVACTWAAYLLSQRPVQIDRLVVVACQFLTGALVMLPFAWYWGPMLPADPWFFGKVAVMAGVFTVIPQALNMYALSGLPSSQLAMLGYLNPILVFVIGLVVFQEQATVVQWLGYATLLVALVLFNLQRVRGMRGMVR